MRPDRNSAAYQDFLQLEEQANPDGTIYVITDNLSSHDSKSTRAWLEGHPRIRHAFIPKGACWLNIVGAETRATWPDGPLTVGWSAPRRRPGVG